MSNQLCPVFEDQLSRDIIMMINATLPQTASVIEVANKSLAIKS